MSKATITETSDWEHQPDVAAKRVVEVSSALRSLMDLSSSTTIYVGEAPQGASTAASLWLLEKIDLTTNPYTITHKINGVWDNRASETYT